MQSPTDQHNLTLDAPIDRWDEAVPLGNGLLGVLLWGEGNHLKLSLDRGDLWDLRRPEAFKSPDVNWRTVIDAVKRGDHALVDKLFNKPAKAHAYPTKLPTGRLELQLDDEQRADVFRLDLRRALGTVQLADGGGQVEVFCASDAPVGMIRVCGTEVKASFTPPGFGVKADSTKGLARGSLASLDYVAPEPGGSGSFRWSRQRCAEQGEYVLAVDSRTREGVTELAFTVVTDRDADDALAEARGRLGRALDTGFDAARASHEQYWRSFWSRSAVDLGGSEIERHYYFVQYLYGAGSRRGCPPLALQGLWTADDGKLPPWKGDYHHDLNTQLTYWPYLGANHLDEGLTFLEFLWALMPRFRAFARQFYQAPGACVPSVMTLAGNRMGGWPQYTCSPTNSAWLAHNFHRHWRYTMDRRFLEERAYPFCREIAQCIDALLEPGADGKLKLPLSSSPEVHGSYPASWLTPNSNYDLSLMRWLFAAVAEMAQTLGNSEVATYWRDRLGQLDELAVGPQRYDGSVGWSVEQTLYVAPGEPLGESHRHFSHTMAIHPLGTLHIEGSDRDRRVIDDSMHAIDCLGHSFWCGYSFSWMACLAARTGRAERALAMLELYLRATVSRNGFHLNGDFRQLGITALNYRPFTLEGNFAVAEAVHEMLLQSWGGVLRIFPAVPEAWRDCGFDQLRAEGGMRVSARRAGGVTIRVSITAEVDAPLCLRDPFAGQPVSASRDDLQRQGSDYVCHLKAGETVVITPA